MASYRKLDLDDTAAGGEVILQTKTLEAQAKDAGATHLHTSPDDILLGVTVSDAKPRDFDGFEESRAPLLNKGDAPSYEVSIGPKEMREERRREERRGEERRGEERRGERSHNTDQNLGRLKPKMQEQLISTQTLMKYCLGFWCLIPNL